MKLNKILLSALLAATSLTAGAADCDITLKAIPIEQGEEVPADVSDAIATRLMAAATKSGVVGAVDSRFFITAKFNHSYKETLAGPPAQTAIKSTMTLYIGDVIDQKVFATTSIDVRGVGTSLNRAYINALSVLNAKNNAFAQFISQGRDKVIDYYDSNYQSILNKAKSAMTLKQYDEALYYSTSIPECSVGYSAALEVTKTAFQAYLDNEGLVLLNKARAAWGANPDQYGAEEAYGYLTQIDPQASCYKEAVAFGQKIASVVKANWDFENVTMYKDAVALEKARITAARDIGVAWGNHQQPITYNTTWLH